MVKNKWSSFALVAALTVGAFASDLGHAAAEPLRSYSVGRITQQRAGAPDRREADKPAQVKRLDKNDNKSRAEVQRMQPAPQRAGRARRVP